MPTPGSWKSYMTLRARAFQIFFCETLHGLTQTKKDVHNPQEGKLGLVYKVQSPTTVQFNSHTYYYNFLARLSINFSTTSIVIIENP